ncbi:MAG: hypothetical protein ACI80V_001660 [Rhodothermales bacterium]
MYTRLQGARDTYTSTHPHPAPLDTLLFIPDISGFTTFVNETEVEHSRHIISELLQLIIDADELGLTVAEVEGDAVFFHSKSDAPAIEDILHQARRTFVRFHNHLKLYESRRICDCGACLSANRLSLKFVAHRGPIGFVEVNGQRKPHGPDVILAHRLLKNDVPSDEYFLATDNLLEGEVSAPEWGHWEKAASEYDSYGSVQYGHLSMAPLLSEVVVPPPLTEYPLMERPVVIEAVIAAPHRRTFELVSNLNLRHLWNDEAIELLFTEERVNRAGTQHQCIVKGNPIDFETIKADFGGDALVLGERVDKVPLVKSFATFWIVRPQGDETHVRVELHYETHGLAPALTGLAFRLFAKRITKKALAKVRRAAEHPDS